MKKTLTGLTLTGALGLTGVLDGCREQTDHLGNPVFIQEGEYKGYKGIASNDGYRRKVKLTLTGDIFEGNIYAEDRPIGGEWEKLEISYLPEGHPLRKLAKF